MNDPEPSHAPGEHVTRSRAGLGSSPRRLIVGRLGALAMSGVIGVTVAGCSSSDDTASDTAAVSTPDVDLRTAAIDVRRDPG